MTKNGETQDRTVRVGRSGIILLYITSDEKVPLSCTFYREKVPVSCTQTLRTLYYLHWNEVNEQYCGKTSSITRRDVTEPKSQYLLFCSCSLFAEMIISHYFFNCVEPNTVSLMGLYLQRQSYVIRNWVVCYNSTTGGITVVFWSNIPIVLLSIQELKSAQGDCCRATWETPGIDLHRTSISSMPERIKAFLVPSVLTQLWRECSHMNLKGS